MNNLPNIKKYSPRFNEIGWGSDELFTSRLDPSFRINDRSGVLFHWVKGFFTINTDVDCRPILILSGNNGTRRQKAACRAGRYYELLQSWKYMVPPERMFPVCDFYDMCYEFCETMIKDEDEDFEEIGLLDSSYFQKHPYFREPFFLILQNLHLLPSNQGESFYRFLLSRLGMSHKSFPLPLIINDSRGVSGLQKQFHREWKKILPILEQHSIQLEL